jgi:hypothetical protein
MSVFREHKSIVDRAASDRARHKKKIDRAIKESIKDVVAEESIIGQNGKKKIRIPVRGLREYRFIFGKNENNKNVGTAGDHDIHRGQKIGKKRAEKAEGQGQGQGGNEAGEEYYDVEVTLEELAEYLFNDLQLPDLEKKKFRFISQESIKRKGYRFKGIRPRLSKKETIKRKIRRKKMAIAAGTYDPNSEERFPFHKNDLKYHHIKPKEKDHSSAVVFFLMDVSGSMTKERKYLARSFFFLLYQFLRYKYERIEVVFISHSTDASRVNEDEFFKKGTVGGTLVSTALDLELEIIDKEYHPNSWNLYTFYAGDGENWSADNEIALEKFKSLKELSQLTVYCEINEHLTAMYPDELAGTGGAFEWAEVSTWKDEDPASLWGVLNPCADKDFKRVTIAEPQHIWKAFSTIFGGQT